MNEDNSLPALLKTDSRRFEPREPTPPGSYILEEEIKTTKDAIKEITQQIPLLPKRTHLPQHHQPPPLITGNNRSRSNNETIKRTSPHAFTIRSNDHLEQTKDEIRIKIILENSRLKNSIENLRQDIGNYQENEHKIVDILRESKAKLTDYKQKLKEKSKRVTEVTDKNITLKGQLTQLEFKISNMTSYSEWQERQIQELKMDITAQATASNSKIGQLEALLKTYEQGLANTGTESHHFVEYINSSPQQALSSGTISEGTPFSMKEMEARDIQSIKYRNSDEDEVRELREDNMNLKARIRELQGEIEQLRSESELRERSVVEDHEDVRKRETSMREEMDNMIERSLSMSQQLSDKASSIQNLQRELMEIREYIKAAEEKYIHSQENYRADIFKLTTEIEQKNIQIQHSLDTMKEMEEYYKKFGEEIKESMDEERSLNQAQSQKSREEIKRLQEELDKYETELVRLTSLSQDLQYYKEQSEEKIHRATIYLQQRDDYENLCADLKAKLEYYQPLSQKNIEYFQQQLIDANQRCIDLEKEKLELTELMERYAAEIRELKNDVAELNRQKNDSLGSHEEIPEVKQESYEEIVQLQSETSLINPIDARNSLKRDDQIAPMFDSHPLEEQDELEEESGQGVQDKDALIEQLRVELQELRISNDELREEVKKYTTEVVEANVDLDKDQEQQQHLKSQLISIQYDNYAKDLQIQDKQEHLVTSQRLIKEKEVQLTSVKSVIQQMSQEIERQKHLIATLEENLRRQKQTIQELMTQISKLEYAKDELEHSVAKIQQEREIEHASKNELESSLQLELNKQREMENELMNSRRLAETAQVEHLSGKARAEQLEVEVERCRNAQKDLEEKIKSLNAEKSRLHEEVIARMTESDNFNEQYSRLQSEIEELRHYRKEELDQIESLKRSTCEIQVAQSSLQGEKDHLIKKISLQSDELTAKTNQIESLSQKLNKANIKIAQLQQFQKQTKPEIDKNLAILSDIINQQKKNIQKLNFQKSQLIAHRQTHVHSITELKSDKKINEQLAGDLEKQLQAEVRSKIDLRNEISKLQDEFDEHIEENNKLKDKVVGCEEEIRRLKLEKDALQSEKEFLIKVNEEIKAKLELSQKTLKQLSINIAGLKESFELSRSSLAQHNLHDSIHKSNEESLSLKLEEEQSKMGISNLKVEISQIQNRHRSVVEDYQHRIRSTSVKVQEITKEKEGKIAQLQATLSLLRHEIDDANIAKDSLQTTVKQLNKAISDNQAHIERLQGQLTESRENISSKDVVISSLERNIAINRGEIDEKDKAILDLQGKLEASRSECKSLRTNQGTLQGRINQLARQYELVKSNFQSEIVKLGDNLQISRKMLQEAEEDHQLKANKLSKEITGYKLMLEENKKENSFQLEQSNRSISEIKNEVKAYLDTIKQKDIELKENKDAINQLREHLQAVKIASSRFEEQKKRWEQQKNHLHQKEDQLQAEVRASKDEINSLRANMNQLSNDFQRIQSELNAHKLTIQHLQNSQQVLTKQKALMGAKIEKLSEQKSRMQSKLQSVALQRNDYQGQCEHLQQENKRLLKRNMEDSQSMQISAMSLVSERKQLEQKHAVILTQAQALNQQIKRLQKQHQTRMENLCLEQRQNLLDIEQKHEDQIHQYIQEIQGCMITIEDWKQKDKASQQEMQDLSNKLEANEKSLKDAENEIGQLTDKILQMTQENNQSNAIIDDLRNSLVDKGNQVEECRDAISKLQEELEELRSQRSPINSSSSIPLSIEAEQKLNEAYEFIEKLTENNKVLELQLKDKTRIEKQLNERFQRQKERENRERHSSCDSFPTKSKIFDEKSQNLATELQDVKMRLSEAEAYIGLLQGEKHHNPPNNEDPYKEAGHGTDLHNRIIELEKQVQNLKELNEYQEAYISQLENNSNLASSVRSRRSAVPSEAGKHKQHHSKLQGGQRSSSMNEKIYLLINFIDSYSRDSKSRQKQEELKSQLTHPVLEELLSTIFYRLQKQSGTIQDNQHALAELQDEIETLIENSAIQKKNNDYLMKQCSTLEQTFKEAEKNCQDLLTEKMNLEADVAECRSYIQELENKLARYERGKDESKKEELEILEQEHESSSDSMMSESADSEMPSSVNQSKEFRSSMDMRGKGKTTVRKSIMRTKSNNFGEDKGNEEFLKKCLITIKALQSEVERIEAQLGQKNRMLNLFLGEMVSKEELIGKLSLIESKLKINDRQIKTHFETSEMEVAALIKDLLRYRQQKDQYGLQNENRKKIDEYLSLLEQQLLKNSKLYEQEGKMQETSRKSDSPLRMGGSLHQIKQDAVNEDKGSSIVSPRNGQVLRSFSNSEGVSESLDIYEIKHNYTQAIRELHELHDELANKQDAIKNTHRNYRIMQQDVYMMLDDIRMSFEEDQYIIEQIEKIKKYMGKHLQEESHSFRMKDSQEKIEEEKVNILVESNQKNMNNLSASKKNENPFQKLLKMNESSLNDLAEAISNENLKEVYRRIEQIMNQRFDDCLDFLNTEKSLIADILKIRDDEAYLQSTMNKLASKLTKQQITDIITNSHNRMEANKTLHFILRDDDAKSMVSDEQDFSPNGDKIRQIRNRVYSRPTELSISMQNQLLQILAAPTRHQFYELIEQYYKILKDFEDKFQAELSEKDERSEKHSIRIKRVLEGPRQNLEYSQDLGGHLQVKPHKHRSSSYTLNLPQNSGNRQ